MSLRELILINNNQVYFKLESPLLELFTLSEENWLISDYIDTDEQVEVVTIIGFFLLVGCSIKNISLRNGKMVDLFNIIKEIEKILTDFHEISPSKEQRTSEEVLEIIFSLIPSAENAVRVYEEELCKGNVQPQEFFMEEE